MGRYTLFYSIYKYPICAWEKYILNKHYNSYRSVVFYLILFLKIVVFIRFRYPSPHSINLMSCCILWEKRISFCFVLYNEEVFSLMTTLCVSQPKLFSLVTSFIILFLYCYYYYYYLLFDFMNILLSIYLYRILIIILVLLFILINIFLTFLEMKIIFSLLHSSLFLLLQKLNIMLYMGKIYFSVSNKKIIIWLH